MAKNKNGYIQRKNIGQYSLRWSMNPGYKKFPSKLEGENRSRTRRDGMEGPTSNISQAEKSNHFFRSFESIGGKLPKWMIYNGTPY